MTRDCPEALPANAAAAARDRRQEEIQRWVDQNDEAYGYLVQAMEENDGAVAALRILKNDDPVNGTKVRTAFQVLLEMYQPEGELEAEAIRRKWSKCKLLRGETLEHLCNHLILLQSQIAGHGIPETPARCKARLIEAMQNGEKEMEVPVQTLHANNEMTYEEVRAFCKRFDGTDTGKARASSAKLRGLAATDVDREPKVCNFCKKNGHLEKSCWKKRDQDRKKNPKKRMLAVSREDLVAVLNSRVGGGKVFEVFFGNFFLKKHLIFFTKKRIMENVVSSVTPKKQIFCDLW